MSVMKGQLWFGILGPLEARAGDRTIALGGAKPRALLALLLLEANQVVARDLLIEALWSVKPPDDPVNALQVYVSQLRKALGHDVIVTRAPGYRISLERDDLDLVDFERLVAEGEQALTAGDAESATVRLEAALRLWRGPPLADLADEPGLHTAIHRLEEIRIAAIERQVEAELALGHHARLVPELEQLVVEHPWREGLCGQLMVGLYRSGRQADALAAYRAARQTLLDELGLEPSPALRQLEQAILVQDEMLELAPSLGTRAAPAVQQRGVVVVVSDPDRSTPLLDLGRALAKRPPRELVLVRTLAAGADLADANSRLNEQRAALLEEAIPARAASFVSDDPGGDITRLAERLDVDLVVLEAAQRTLGEESWSDAISRVAADAPCDVGILCHEGQTMLPGAVLVPFGGQEHEWAAVEVGAWIARAQDRPLRLAGAAARRGRHDASRILADASLAVQHALGVPAEPVLVKPGASELLESARSSALLVLGFPDRWQQEGLGETRLRLAREADRPVLLVRGGVRPSGLAPRESVTRYTWSLGSVASA
jgi:DNA-binding SARP family transcriptional activator